MVFPEPFGPRSATTSPRADVERERLDRPLRAEALRETAVGDHGAAVFPIFLPERGRVEGRRPRERTAAPGEGEGERSRDPAHVRARLARRGLRDVGQRGGPREGRGVLHRHQAQDGEGPLRRADRRRGEAVGQDVGRGQVPPEVVEDAGEAVGPLAPAVAVEVGLVVAGPVVAREHGVGLPRHEVERRHVADEGVALEAVAAGGVVEHDRHVGAGDHVAAEGDPVRALDEDAPGVVRDQVGLGEDVVAALEEESHRREAAVPEEAVAAEDEALRVHDGGARRPVLEGVVLEHVVVREHVVEPVAHVARHVAAQGPLRGVLEVEAVAHVHDLVVVEPEALQVVRVDPRALLAGVLAGDPAHPAALDHGAVRLAQVDAEEGLDDLEVAQGRVAGGAVDPRGVEGEVAAAPAVDREAFDRHAVGAHADDAAVARAEEARPAAADEAERLVEDQVAGVRRRPRPRRSLRARPRRRGPGGETARRRAGGPRARPAAPAPSPARARRGAPRRAAGGPTRESRPRARTVRRPPPPQAMPFLRRLPPPLPPGQEERRQEDERREAERVGSELRVRVHLEVRELLVAEHRRHEGIHPHRRLRVEGVTVVVHLVPERPEGEQAEVDEQDRHVHEVRGLARARPRAGRGARRCRWRRAAS